MALKVLMLGWEFPPVVTGGLGVACMGLTRELSEQGVEVTFVLPRKQETMGSPRFLFADVQSKGYGGGVYLSTGLHIDGVDWYEARLDEIRQFADFVREVAVRESFDVIHAHDWKSYLAGVAAHEVTGKPLVVHVHSLAYDQAGGQGRDPLVYAVERKTFAVADAVVAVSHYTRKNVVREHDTNPEKVHVAYNGADLHPYQKLPETLTHLKEKGKKIVLYVGRITIQKGVDHLIHAAKKVLEVEPNTVFIIGGNGDMEGQVIQMVADMGLQENFLFAGWVENDDRDCLFQAADLFVMPSVSEPFGIVPLEALTNGTPVIISKQSGVSEVLKHALKVDFWDIDEMANQIVAALRFEPLAQQITNYGNEEIKNLTWAKTAAACVNIYKKLLPV